MTRHLFRAAALAGLLCAGTAFALPFEPLSAGAGQLLSRLRGEEWAVLVAREIARVSGDAPLAARAYDLVLSAIDPIDLPADGLEAARDLHLAARAADAAWRRGVPAPALRAELRAAWALRDRSAAGFTLRLEGRADQSVQRFAAGTRSAWDAESQGRNGPADDPAGAGGGPR
jgi:hypothetical protein